MFEKQQLIPTAISRKLLTKFHDSISTSLRDLRVQTNIIAKIDTLCCCLGIYLQF